MTASRFVSGFVVVLTAALLASCGDSTTTSISGAPIANTALNRQLAVAFRALPPRGGTFSGRYSGTYRGKLCGFGGSGYYDFNGTGAASFLHRSTEKISIESMWQTGLKVCEYWKGSVSLTSTKRNGDQIQMGIANGQSDEPCAEYSYVVTGGLGRFRHATGNGYVYLSCYDKNEGTYSDRWAGTLHF